jgi:hypothetical protein
MTTAIAHDEVIRCILPKTTKEQFQLNCIRQGQKMSERLRQLIVQDITASQGSINSTAASRLTAILDSAQAKNQASNLSTPTIEEIDAFIESVRDERIKDGYVA